MLSDKIQITVTHGALNSNTPITNNIIEAFPNAISTICRVSSTVELTICAIWHDVPDTYGETITIKAGTPYSFMHQLDAIEILTVTGTGTIIIQSQI